MTILIGQGAPNFTAITVMPDNAVNSDFNLGQYIMGKPAVLFFYAVNYSYVCPTELIALNNKMDEFNKRKTSVVAVSIDSHLSHLNWKRTPRENAGIGDVQFPIVSDITKEISRRYGILVSQSVAIRAAYIIDKKGYIRSQMVYDFPIGRNVDEILRVLDAQQHYEQTGKVCPANWQEGDEGLACNENSLNNFIEHYADSL